jgi:putative hydrolase of the HAD superfamily
VPLLLCDLDGTILDRAAAFKAWATTFAAEHSSAEKPVPADFVDWVTVEDRDGRRDKRELFDAIRHRLGLPETTYLLTARFRAEFPTFIHLDRQVVVSLRRFREAGWKIAIVSNGSGAQLDKIAATGLSAFVDSVTVSDLVGASKPAAAIFEAAADSTGGSVADAWVIGDSADTDIAGARILGCPSIWVSHGRTWMQESFAPTHIASSFGQAAAILLDQLAG